MSGKIETELFKNELQTEKRLSNDQFCTRMGPIGKRPNTGTLQFVMAQDSKNLSESQAQKMNRYKEKAAYQALGWITDVLAFNVKWVSKD